MGEDEFRKAMAGVCSPVTIVTTTADQAPHGATVSAIASLSLDPPMISVALNNRSRLLHTIQSAGRFGVNVLSDRQQDLATRFADSTADRFRETAWEFDHGLPRLQGSANWIACELANTVPGGDHVLLLGHVVRASYTSASPLIYAQRTFGTHSGLASSP